VAQNIEQHLASSPPKRDTDGLDVTKLAYAHAWNWFDFHARQRMSVLNFFILASGLFASAYGVALRVPDPVAALLVACGGAVLAFVFLMLEIRNREMVRWAERVLIDLEKDYIFYWPRQDCATAPKPGILAWEQDILDATRKDRVTLADPDEGRIYAKAGRWKCKMLGFIPAPLSHRYWISVFHIGMFVFFVGLAIRAGLSVPAITGLFAVP